ELLQSGGLLEGLGKYAGQMVRRRASSPKFQAYNNALITAQSDLSFAEARKDGAFWGRLVESAVGGWLVNAAQGTPVTVHYWASGDREVDFVLAKGAKAVAIEVKSNRGQEHGPPRPALGHGSLLRRVPRSRQASRRRRRNPPRQVPHHGRSPLVLRYCLPESPA
ncbi:MAG: DUF4143 domain-containing protein, partial [Planctomycetota bacterium]|nr:DUF4143 domain-containing protein [Planctomycetota bacterium]